MAARRRQKNEAVTANQSATDSNSNNAAAEEERKNEQKQRLNDAVKSQRVEEFRGMHLAPLPLVMIVLVCSGIMWVMAFRDVMATGRSIAGPMDDAMLHFTKSVDFFDDSGGWKSKQGGLSAIEAVTTDDNNMGGLFVRKVGGAAALAYHTQKIAPLVFQPAAAHWAAGHFAPVLLMSVVGNLIIVLFYALYADDLKAAGAGDMGMIICALLLVEAIAMLGYTFSARRGAAASSSSATRPLPDGKTESSVPSKIVMKTVGIVSGFFSVIAMRDLFFAGHIMPIPRDDIYLEWTGALIHSPPPGSVEHEEAGLEAALFLGDKFVSQLMALYMLLTCMFKFTSAFLIRVGKDGSGETKSKLFWRVQALGDALITFIFRLFVGAAISASLDLKWHLMLLGYETFILFMYAFY
mmetsp:Transcript_6880/g.15114  ORF Transcript_6880/g.15114 Transcript_6880/m.15114 type:complete len:409 (+) Transcript_6880:167-1393(+)